MNPMSIYEAIGMVWAIFAVSVFTVEFFYLAYVGYKVIVRSSEGRDLVVVRMLPVNWGSKEHQHSVRVPVESGVR